MKNGMKVFDTDTHLAPSAETLRPYLASVVLERIPDLDEHRMPIRTNRAGKRQGPPYKHWFRSFSLEEDSSSKRTIIFR